MNKKIKSLIVAGLLVVGMSGNAFGLEKDEYNGNDGKGQCSHEVSEDNKINSPSAGEHILGGVVKITVSEDKKYAKVEPLKDENGYDLAKIKAVHMKGGPNYNCFVLGEGETWVADLSCPLNDGGNIPEISHITVDFEVVPESERPSPEEKNNEPQEPEKPKTPTSGSSDPVTGDTSSMVFVGTAVLSAAVLFMNRKED